ncbi:MAG: universal stress protein [Kofleriaceae bacterium]
MNNVIVFTTDLSGDDRAAFVHACALAAASGARLVTIHANAPAERASSLWDATPLAERWGRTIDHRRVCHECCDDVTDTLLDAIRGYDPQLVICGTHARRGFSALVRGSIATALARNVDVPALIVPNDAAGFVDEATGRVSLRELIVPAGSRDEAVRGVAAARAFATSIGLDVPIEVVHAGRGALAVDDLRVPVLQRPGEIEAAILAVARERPGAAIVMVTHGHDGVHDVVAGSHTEHVIRDGHVPVLSVHAPR